MNNYFKWLLLFSFPMIIATVLVIWGIKELPPKGLGSPYPNYPYKADYSWGYCWTNEKEWLSYKDSQAKIKAGVTVYEVIEMDRCVKK